MKISANKPQNQPMNPNQMQHHADLQTHHIVVTEKNARIRLDKFVSEILSDYSRSYVLRLIKTNYIHVNNQSKKSAYLLKPGDQIRISIPENEEQTAIPEPIPLNILYEDQDLLIVNKQAGLVVHPSPGHSSGTLVNALLHYNSIQFSNVDRYGIVHRLDKDTTGCLLVAKNRMSQTSLNNAFKDRTIQKKYCALVCGQMSEKQGIINYPIGRHPTNRKKMSIHARHHRIAETHWKVSYQFEHFTLLDVLLKTGRTHQIRVHLSSINRPIVGDPIYGKNRKWNHQNDNVLSQLKQINRQMLHAKKLGFIHPTTKQYMQVNAPLPDDMAQVLDCFLSSIRIT